MQDRWVITFLTPRGEFRVWDKYRDRSLQMARELKALGVSGVELWDAQKSKVVWRFGDKTSES